MFFRSLKNLLNGKKRPICKSEKSRKRFQLGMENLEERLVPAGLMVYEPFNYYVPSNAVDSAVPNSNPAAISLLGEGPGAGGASTIGLTGTWSNDGPGTDLVVAGTAGYPTEGNSGTFVPAGLTNYDTLASYTDINGATQSPGGVPASVAPMGNSALSNGVMAFGTTSSSQISLSSSFGDPVSGSATYYVSFIITNGYAVSGNPNDPQAFELISTDANQDAIDIGWNNSKVLAAGNDSQVMSGSGTGIAYNQSISLVTGSNGTTNPYHLVAAITFTAGADTTVKLYVDPGFGSAPGANSLISTADLGKDYGSIGAIGIKGANRAYYGEVRIADSYQDLWSDPRAQGASSTPAGPSSDPRFNGIQVAASSNAVEGGAVNGTVSDGSQAINVVSLGGSPSNVSGAGLFEFSGLSAAVPTGYSIASANIILTGLYPDSSSAPISLTAYNVTTSWNDTGGSVSPTVNTSSAVASTAGGTITGTEAEGRYTINITNLANEWLTGALANNGIALVQTASSSALDVFGRLWGPSSDSTGYDIGEGDRPVLVLTLTPTSGIAITSNGGAPATGNATTGTVNVPQGTTAVTNVSVSNPTSQSLSYSLTGTNASLFSISNSGVLTFNSAPSSPAQYSVTVNVSGTGGSGLNSASQVLTVNVTPEAAPTLNSLSNDNLSVSPGPQTVSLTGIGGSSASPYAVSVHFSSGTPGDMFGALNAATVSNAGNSYTVGDTLTVVGGIGTSATLQVTGLTSSTSTVNGFQSTPIAGGGNGYAVNDILTVVGGTGTSATLKVTSVGSGGVITGISVNSAGSYTATPNGNPTIAVSVTGGAGTGATFNLKYTGRGISTFTILTGGSYTADPGNGASVTGGTGTAATFNLVGFTGSSSQTAGVVPAGYWNGRTSSDLSAAVVDSNGAATGITVSANQGFASNLGTNGYNINPYSSSALNNSLMSSGMSNGTGSITLGNLQASFPNGYDVYVYLAPEYTYANAMGTISDGTHSVSYDVAPTPFDGFTPTNSQSVAGNYVVLSNETNNSLQITNTPAANGWDKGGFVDSMITGIEIVPHATPLPLSVTASSSNTSLVPNPYVTYTPGGSTGTLTYTPTPGMSGSAVISVNVSDGNYTTTQSFTVNVAPPAPSVTSISPTFGTTGGGTPVTITGSNFSQVTAVDFGNTPATSFTVNSSTSITAVSPSGSGTVDVTVTTAGGTSTTSSADHFVYGSNPGITQVSPDSGPVAGGTTVAITGSNFGFAYAVYFGSTAAQSFSINGAGTSITAVSPAASTGGVVDITVDSFLGNSPISPNDEFTYDTNTTTTLGSLTPITYGTNVTFTATVSGDPSVGTVTFTDNGNPLPGTSTVPVVNGTASYTTFVPLSVTSNSIAASYSGGTGFNPSATSGGSSQVVNPATVTVSGISANNKPYDGTTNATVNAQAQVVSLHFYGNSGTLGTGYTDALASADAAGVYSAENWNNVGTSATGSASNLNNSAGTATTVGVSWAAGAIDDQFVYGDGQDALPTGGSKGNQELMSSTLASQPQYTHVELTNLPGLYSVYIYLEEPATFWGALGTIYAGDSTEFTTNTSTGLPSGSDNPVAQTGFQVFQGLPPSGTFNGTFTQTTSQSVAGNYVLLQNLNLSTLALTVAVSSSNGETYAGTGIAGIQIVSGPTLSGVIPSDVGNVSLVTSGATGTFASPNVGNNISVQVSGLTLTGSAAGNYTLVQPTVTADITPASSSVSLTDSGPTPSIVGQSVGFMVNTTGVPDGETVTLEDADNMDAVVGSPITIEGGAGSESISDLPVGPHSIFAVYAGDGNYSPSQSSAIEQDVQNVGAPAVSGVSPTTGSVLGGTTVTITGTNLANASAVDFGSTAGTIVTDTSNSITVTSPAESPGTVDITVTTPGGMSGTSSADQFTYQALSTTTTLRTLSPITYGHQVTFTATISAGSGTPNSGTVTFEDNGVALAGSSTVNVSAGMAQFTTTSYLTVTTNDITAVYSGGGNYAGSNSAGASQVVNPADVTVGGLIVNSKVYDGTTNGTVGTAPAPVVSVHFTPENSGNEAGGYTDQLGSGDVAGVDAVSNWNNVGTGASGSASGLINSSSTATTVGVQWASGYGLDDQFNYGAGNDDRQPQGGTQGNQELMGSGIVNYQSSEYTHVELTNLPSSYSVYVYIQAPAYFWSGYGNIYAGDSTEFTTSTSVGLPAGSDSPVATDGYEVLNSAFNGTFTQSTSQSVQGNYVEFTGLSLSTLALTLQTSGIDVGGTFAGVSIAGIQIVGASGATLSGVLPGDVGNVSVVTSGAYATFSSPNVGNNISATINGLTLTGSAAGNYVISPLPTGTADITPASSSVSLTDNGPTPSNYGQAVGFTVNSTGVPDGETVNLEDADNEDAVVGSVTIEGGTGSTTISDLSVGSHSIFAAYAGDGNYSPSQSGAVEQDVQNVVATPAVTGVSPTTGSVLGGTSVTITGTNLANASAVDFGSVAGTIVSDTSNSIVVTSPAEAAGTVDITVTTAGGMSATSGADQFTYQAVATSTSLTDSGPNPSVVGTAVSYAVSTTGVPDGSTVYLEDADNSDAIVGSVVVSGGTGSTTVSDLSIGTHHIFAIYLGTTTYASSQWSPTLLQTVNPIQVSSVTTNGDFIGVTAASEGLDSMENNDLVTLTTDGNSGFAVGNQIVVGGYTGSYAGYNGTWTIRAVAGNQVEYIDTNSTTLPATGRGQASLGYALSVNTSSALYGTGNFDSQQRSVVDSIVYTFNTAVNLQSNAISLAVDSGATTTVAAAATAVPTANLTSLNGGTVWVVSFSGGSGSSRVVGHSIADGVYTITLNSADVTAVAGGSTMTTARATDTFFRLYGDDTGYGNGPGGLGARVNTTDLSRFDNTYNVGTGGTGYKAEFDYDGTGSVDNSALSVFDNNYTAFWSGFTPTI